jgi:signal transduction histidine kinase
MKFWQRKPPFMLMLTLALLALLPVLAILQYRWMGQVSEGERQRLQKNLKEGANKFAADFDREMARIFVNFQAAEIEPDKLAESYVACYARWSQESAFPQLIKNIYIVEADASRAPLLKKLNLNAKRLEAQDWSADLESLKSRLQAQYENHHLPEPLQARLANLPKSAANNGNVFQILKDNFTPVDTDTPALIIHRMPEKPDKSLAAFPLNLFNYVIVTLDLDYIKQQVIPQLAARYFSGSNGLDYNLTVIKGGNSQEVVYQSDAVALKQNEATDSTAAFFGVRLQELNEVVKERAGKMATEDEPVNKSSARVAIQVFRSQSVPPPVVKQSPSAANSVEYTSVESKVSETDGWQLLLKHHAGSLGAVVASARRKNLAISFGILLLMAVSIAMILISARRAERLARQQMEFVAGVSHELRTPLAVIRSAGENLSDGVIDESAQVKRYGQLIASEGRRLTEMVEQILEFSGIQSGRKNYELRPVAIENVIENAVNACRYLIAEGGFEIKQYIADDLPLVSADEAALSRSLQNLLTNAMKYSGDNRLIEIQATTKASDKNSEIFITVSDKGLGIAPDELPHIFEPFYRGNEAISAQIHGNGLGLSLVKNIIEAHNGKITVTSHEGKGSAFTIYLKGLESEVRRLESGIERLESQSETTRTGIGIQTAKFAQQTPDSRLQTPDS